MSAALGTRRLALFSSNLLNQQIRRNASSQLTKASSKNQLAQVGLTKAKEAARIFLYYARVELTPPMPQELPQVFRGFGNLIAGARTGAWRNVTFREAWLNGLVTVEVLCWFFVGEVLGKESLIGYQV